MSISWPWARREWVMGDFTEINKNHALISVSRFDNVNEVLVAVYNSSMDERAAIYLTPQEAVNLGSYLLNLGQCILDDHPIPVTDEDVQTSIEKINGQKGLSPDDGGGVLIKFMRRIWCRLFHHKSHRWDFNKHPPEIYCKRCGSRWAED